MKKAIIKGLAGTLLFFCASAKQAGASDQGSKDLCTTILVAPFFTTTYPITKSAEASAGSSDESRAPTVTRSEETSPASHEFSAGTSQDSRNDSRESSASSSARREAAPRKIIVPWRARSEAASFLASPEKAPPSVLLRSILTKLRQQQRAASGTVPTDRMLAAQLIALPPDQGQGQR